MDGRRGLVPITFIQKLSGDELLEFNQRFIMEMKEYDKNVSTTVPQYLEHVYSGIVYLLNIVPSSIHLVT